MGVDKLVEGVDDEKVLGPQIVRKNIKNELEGLVDTASRYERQLVQSQKLQGLSAAAID